MCLTAGGMVSCDGKDRIKAIKAEANRDCKESVWRGMFHVTTLTSVSGRPLYSVYPNTGSWIRDFLHKKILPRILNEGAQNTVYIMWTQDGSPDTTPRTWYKPNHFIPIFRVSHKPAYSKSKTPGSSRNVANPKPSLIKKGQQRELSPVISQVKLGSTKKRSRDHAMRWNRQVTGITPQVWRKVSWVSLWITLKLWWRLIAQRHHQTSWLVSQLKGGRAKT